MKALFVGRFQPFHSGHLSALRAMADTGADEVVVAIGSAQYGGTLDNPYDLATRQTMINSVLKNEKINYRLAAIPDIHDETRWVDHLVKITGPIDAVYTGNNVVARLFHEKNYSVYPVELKLKISGTELRHMIASGDERWKEYVPKEIIGIISNVIPV